MSQGLICQQDQMVRTASSMVIQAVGDLSGRPHSRLNFDDYLC